MEKTEAIDQLSGYPHIQAKIELLWGTPMLSTFIERLMLDSERTVKYKNEQRSGLPREIGTLLLILANQHSLLTKDDVQEIRNRNLWPL